MCILPDQEVIILKEHHRTMNKHLYTYIDPPNERHLQQISQVLQSDGVIALPMDTNWAFCCDINSRKALGRMRLLKPSHPNDRPFSLICSDISMASNYGKIGHRSYRILRQILPGKFTVILQGGPQFPKRIRNKQDSVGIRIPDESITLELIRHYGGPLLATSVPRIDGKPLLMGYEVYEQHGHGLDMLSLIHI